MTAPWDEVAGATEYEVWFHTADDSGGATRFDGDTNTADTSCVITGLVNDTIYYVWVKAKNAYGVSGFGPPASGTPAAPLSPPAAPGAPTITLGDTQLTVSWAAVTGATSYQAWYNTTNNSASASQFGGDITSRTSCIITGLTNGTTYYVWVKAKNSAGTSE